MHQVPQPGIAAIPANKKWNYDQVLVIGDLDSSNIRPRATIEGIKLEQINNYIL